MRSLPLAPPLPASVSAVPDTLRALVALTKPQLAFMSVITAMVAYGTARPATPHTLATLAGTALAAGGALSLNQWWERRADALMRRTDGRPLPRGQISPALALAWSLALSTAGLTVLAALVNLATAALAALTILLYGVIYTPLKMRTRWATEIGAVSGALPALLGNAAAGDLRAAPGVTLTVVLLCWQIPHFFAIGWRHRADYRGAGFKLFPAVDCTGRSTAAWSLFYTALLVPVSVAPWALGWLGPVYGVTALVAGGWFLRHAWQFATAPDRDTTAKNLFLASILYLPLILAALALDRLLVR